MISTNHKIINGQERSPLCQIIDLLQFLFLIEIGLIVLLISKRYWIKYDYSIDKQGLSFSDIFMCSDYQNIPNLLSSSTLSLWYKTESSSFTLFTIDPVLKMTLTDSSLFTLSFGINTNIT